MLRYLILLFTAVPLIELFLLVKVGRYIGAGYTVVVVIITGVAGAYLAKLQGLLTLAQLQKDINQGHMPAERLFDGFLILCGGLMLLTPGFITDFMGFMVLIPFIRGGIKRYLKRKAESMINQGRVISVTSFKSF